MKAIGQEKYSLQLLFPLIFLCLMNAHKGWPRI